MESLDLAADFLAKFRPGPGDASVIAVGAATLWREVTSRWISAEVGHMKETEHEHLKVQSFIAVLRKSPYRHGVHTNMSEPSAVYVSHDECLQLAFSLRKCGAKAAGLRSVTSYWLILGDDAECRDGAKETPMANAVSIAFDLANNYLCVTTSIVGLPPVFIYRDSDKVIVASDVHLLQAVRDVNLHFNPQSIMEMSTIGYPIGGKTLFKEVEMLPTGSSLTWNHGEVAIKKLWTYRDYVRPQTTGTDVERLMCAFKRALTTLDLSQSFLSLTGGLDTRTILAALIARSISVPAYTMTGCRPNVDAMISSMLCKAYRINHDFVVLDDAFLKDLPNYAMEASRLSGGLCSLDEAHEVYFYSVINKNLGARLSGNLGNQLGRQGTERVSMRNASSAVLHKELRCPLDRPGVDWRHSCATRANGIAALGFLLENELPSASVANFCIGSNYVVQQTPYATRAFIEEVLGAFQVYAPKSQQSLRFRDLRHRFIGHNEARSFQVRIIQETGGYLSACPINWGWTATGGFSLSGRINGGLAFLDAVFCRYFPSIMAKRGSSALFFTGMHDYRYTAHWLSIRLREFVHDTLNSFDAINSGLFDCVYLKKALAEHYLRGREHTKEIQLALDLALAQKMFNARLS